MAEFLGIAAVFAFFAAVVAGLYIMGKRIRTRGRSSLAGSLTGVFSPLEEIWHPAAHRARLIAEAVEQQKAPAPAPGDPPEPEEPPRPDEQRPQSPP